MCVCAFTGAIVLPLVGAGMFGNHLRQGWLITSSALLVTHLVYGVALSIAMERYIDRVASANRIISRRRVVRAVGYSVLAIGIYDIGKSLLGSWLGSGSGRVKRGNGVFPDIENLALEVTPTRDFYQVSKNAFDPQVDSRRWKLDVTGLVENPVSFSYEDLKALPSVDGYATLACISNEVGGDLIGTALWRGVRLKNVLNQAVLKPGVVDIFLRASDDYTDSIPLDRAIADGTLLVYEMNGEPLTPEHGAPLRLASPTKYGIKLIKRIGRIEFSSERPRDFWAEQGYDWYAGH
jgi:hypothetical protein